MKRGEKLETAKEAVRNYMLFDLLDYKLDIEQAKKLIEILHLRSAKRIEIELQKFKNEL